MMCKQHSAAAELTLTSFNTAEVQIYSDIIGFNPTTYALVQT